MGLNSERRAPKCSHVVYLDNELAAATVTAAQDLRGRGNAKQEVVWNLERVAREYQDLHSF